MTTELIVVAAGVAVLWFGLLYLRVPTFAALFSVLVGQMLSSQAGQDAYQFASSVSGVAEFQYVQIALLVLPLILTLFFLKGRLPKSRIIMEAMPALFTAITLLLLVYPLLPVLKTAVDIATNDRIEQYTMLAYIGASILGLISVWTSFPKSHGDSKHHDK